MDASPADPFREPLSIFRRKKVEFAEAPEFTQRLNSFLEVEVGKSAAFVGQFKSLPEVKVRWFKDEEQLSGGGKHVFECVRETGVVRLTILHLNRKDEGAYKCRVENQEGAATSTGYLSVIASKNRGRKSSKRKCGTERVSSPPLLKPIAEQKSIEESEEKEYSSMPPSPLHNFLSSIRHSAKSLNAPIVYGPLENFDDILETESLTDDEEVFEVNSKGLMSSDDEDFSTGESSSSEAETVRTPTDQMNLPRMLGLNKYHDHHHHLSKFTPVIVRTSKKHQENSNSASCTANTQVATQQSTKVPSSSSSSSSSSPPSTTSNPTQIPLSPFFPLSSQSRPLIFPHSGLQLHLKHDVLGRKAHVEWNRDHCCFLACFLALATFFSVKFSISPLDVVLIVGIMSAFFFLKTPENDSS